MKIRIYEKNQLLFFPIYALTIDYNNMQGAVTRDNGYENPQIFLVNSGEGVLNIDNKSFTLSEGDLFFINENTPHSYFGTNEAFNTSYISFTGAGFDGIKKYYNLTDYGVYKNKNRGSFEASVKHLYKVYDTTHELSALSSMAFSSVISFFDEACLKESTPIESVYKYIEENYHKAISLDDILSVYPYSKAKLCREFKNVYNETIFEKITSVRLEHAHYMLKNFPHMTLREIAFSCGFNDVSYFCKMYKRAYAKAPKS